MIDIVKLGLGNVRAVSTSIIVYKFQKTLEVFRHLQESSNACVIFEKTGSPGTKI